MNIGDCVVMTIHDLTEDGAGIGRVDKAVVFVPHALPGDEMEIRITGKRKRIFFGKPVRMLEPSPYRISSICPYYAECGNCIMMELDKNKEKQLKKDGILNTMRRIGSVQLEDFPFYTGQREKYRNKVEWKIQEGQVGYYRMGSHQFVPIEHCVILKEELNALFFYLKRWIQGEKKLQGVMAQVNAKGEIRVIFDGIFKDPPATAPKHIQILGRTRKKNFHINPFPFTQQVGDKEYLLSSNAFFQVNQDMTKTLFDIVKDFADLKRGDHLVELYSGVGAMSIYLADKDIAVTGVEVVDDAVTMANENARRNGVPHARFIAGKSENLFGSIKKPADLLLVDPPRAGLHQNLTKDILKATPKRLLYVSCNPATLARDIKRLSENYHVEKVAAVDMFPRTVHVECVALMSRVED